MTDMPLGYYNRHDPAKNYEKHLFRAGKVFQSAEANEIQEAAIARAKGLGDALFKDGDVVRDARVVVNEGTGETQCESGAVYLRGAVRGVPTGNITIPIVGSVAIGIWLIETVVTEAEDAGLLDPAAETRNYNEPGAHRLKIEPQWGYADDGTENAEFFPIYYADAGVLRAKEPPPQLDSVSQAIARYDRDSTGSSYIVHGLAVARLDDVAGDQIYSVQAGRARINGFAVALNTARRLVYEAVPDLRFIDSEPHTSSTAGDQRVDLDRTPIASITQVRITKESTSSISHGVSGSMDPIPATSVVDIVEVTQGATTYVKDTDYKLTAGKVDWSLAGAEPAPGSTYSVTYEHIATVTPTLVDDTGFTVTDAVPGSLILTNYYVKLPRIDRLCLDDSGQFVWLTGVSTDYDPVRPQVPSNLLALCQVIQNWNDTSYLISDAVKLVSMSDLEEMNDRLDIITDLIAQQKLAGDISQRESAAKKGVFVDPFLDDLQRDQGSPQDAAIVGGALTLPIDGDAYAPSADVSGLTTCTYTLVSVLEQTMRTGSMNINPYMAFSVRPLPIALNPAFDRWTVTQTSWLSTITLKFVAYAKGWHGSNRFYITQSSSTRLVSRKTTQIENLREIDVEFRCQGFGPGETIASMTFDGIAVTPTTL